MSSPFDFLQDALESGRRISVTLRERGSVSGILAAFDRHFNLVLKEAEVDGKQLKSYFLRGDGVVFVY